MQFLLTTSAYIAIDDCRRGLLQMLLVVKMACGCHVLRRRRNKAGGCRALRGSLLRLESVHKANRVEKSSRFLASAIGLRGRCGRLKIGINYKLLIVATGATLRRGYEAGSTLRLSTGGCLSLRGRRQLLLLLYLLVHGLDGVG